MEQELALWYGRATEWYHGRHKFMKPPARPAGSPEAAEDGDGSAYAYAYGATLTAETALLRSMTLFEGM